MGYTRVPPGRGAISGAKGRCVTGKKARTHPLEGGILAKKRKVGARVIYPA